jgi:S1-C subfamily serine protease
MKSWLAPTLLCFPALLAAYAMAGGGLGDATWLGLTVQEMEPVQEARWGVPVTDGRVVVVEVEEAALAAGVMVRDVVVGINGQHVDSIGSFLSGARAVMARRASDGRLADVVLSINRFGRHFTITIPAEMVERYSRR